MPCEDPLDLITCQHPAPTSLLGHLGGCTHPPSLPRGFFFPRDHTQQQGTHQAHLQRGYLSAGETPEIPKPSSIPASWLPAATNLPTGECICLLPSVGFLFFIIIC